MQKLNYRKINVQSYVPGKSNIFRKKNIIKLSANESALGQSPRSRKIISSIKKLDKYPDSKTRTLRREISQKFKCNFDQIICGSGSDEVIQLLCQLFLQKKDEVIVPQYSFLMYRIYSNIIGSKVIFSRENKFKVSVKGILDKVSNKTKIVFLANPNNPTGTYLTKIELLELRKKLRQNILLVIDDAYYEYMVNKDYKSGLELFKNKKNVFVLRTFSKIYGLASLRIGWGYGSKDIVKELLKIKPPFNINKIAEMAAVEALKDKSFISKSVKHNLKWAYKIKKALENYKIETNKVSANFLLLDFDNCRYSAIKIKKSLEKKGILLRSLEAYKIKNKLRLTIGNTRENILLLKTLEKIFGK